MKKILIGGAFLIGGYWLIKTFLNKDLGDVDKPKLDFVPTDTELLGTLPDGTEIRWTLDDRQLTYDKLRDLEDRGVYSQTLFKDDFDIEKIFKGYSIDTSNLKNLQNIKPYSIDTSNLKNVGKVGSFDLGFPTPEEMALSIEKYKTGTPIQPTWSR